MPLYEYACRACHHRFEELVRAGERPACPRCAGADLEKLPSVFAVNAPSGAAGPTPFRGGGSGGDGGGCGTCGDPRGPGACALD